MSKGVLFISHGSRDESWVQLIDQSIERACVIADARGKKIEVVSSYMEIVEGRLIQAGIDELERRGVDDLYVVPFFLSHGSTHVDDIAQAFGEPRIRDDRAGEFEPYRISPTTRVSFGKPVGSDAGIADLLLESIKSVSTNPEREGILVIGHGSKERLFHGRWRDGLLRVSRDICRQGGFAHADIAMLLPNQAACKLRALARRYPQLDWIIVPMFLSNGYFTQKMIPERLALSGVEYKYNAVAMLPHDNLVNWLAEQIQVADAGGFTR